jgi:hypothetical protein
MKKARTSTKRRASKILIIVKNFAWNTLPFYYGNAVVTVFMFG